MTIHEFADDLAKEVVLGCDRYTKEDILVCVKMYKFDTLALRKEIELYIKQNYPHGLVSPYLIKEQLDYWFT